MPEEKRGRGRPKKIPTTETNAVQSSPTVEEPINEFNSYYNNQIFSSIFGFDIFSEYTPEEISNMVKDPILHNRALRKLSNELYSSNGLFTQCVDYCTAMPTLDNVVIPRGKSKQKKEQNRSLMESALRTMHHKDIMRDALFKSMIDGIAFYYCEFTENVQDNKKYLTDFDVEQIYEINSMGINMSAIPLPTDYTRIIGRKNSSYVLAINLEYFANLSESERSRKLRLYPKEIRDGYTEWEKNNRINGNWLKLDNRKTIVSKIRSRVEEAWGRPLVLAAIKNILYSFYFQDTCRGTLDEINNRIIYETFPEGKDKGTCSLNKAQQENQHNTVKQAVMTKNDRNSTSFFSVASGTKIDVIKADTTLLDEKNSSYIQDQIGIDLGFMANLLSGTGSGNFASQQNNLQLLLSEIFMWIEPISEEFVKVINENIIKDRNNPVGLYYLPCSIITRSEFTNHMKELYLQGKGSLTAWIASTGMNSEAYLELMNYEVEQDFENRYPVHMTSYTASGKTNDDVGRPETENPTSESTIVTKSNNGNSMPSPSD